MAEDKPFCISKWAVSEAWTKVRANRGAAGVDDVSIEQFEKKLDNNLYRIWNRLSSGSYMPPPVKRVLIPKADGKQRPLGIPTVGDRVAQMIVKWELEPKVEPMFHPDSYGTSYEQALAVKAAVEARLRSCKLEMHPDKTRIVYCRDGQRRQDYPHIQFDFLGYTFHARDAKGPQGVVFTSFLPAISMKAVKAIVTGIRQWKLHLLRRAKGNFHDGAGIRPPGHS